MTKAKKKTVGVLLIAVLVVAAALVLRSLWSDETAGSGSATRSVARVDHNDDGATTKPADDRAHGADEGDKPLRDDVDIDKLADEFRNRQAQRAAALLRNPVHTGRARLQKHMRQETPEETFLRLTDKDSIAMLMPIMGGFPFSPGDYRSDVVTVYKMVRMRKLLADARKNPERLIPFLEQQIVAMVKKFPQLSKEFAQELKKSEIRTEKGLLYKFQDLPDVLKYRLRTAAAVYVLSEVTAFKSLPALTWVSSQGKPNDEADSIGTGPVNRKFLFYAMHKLVKQYPEESLSKDARTARNLYLAKAKTMKITGSKPSKVTSWRADYHESDFRQMLPAQGMDMRGQPTIEMERYPLLGNLSTENVEELLNDLRGFVSLAFPNSQADTQNPTEK